MVRAHVKARELGVHLLCGVQISVAPPDVELTPSPVSIGAGQGEHEGRGPGWGKDTDDPLPAGKATGRRRNAKRAKPRQVAAGSRKKPSTSAMVLLATDRAGWAN